MDHFFLYFKQKIEKLSESEPSDNFLLIGTSAKEWKRLLMETFFFFFNLFSNGKPFPCKAHFFAFSHNILGDVAD